MNPRPPKLSQPEPVSESAGRSTGISTDQEHTAIAKLQEENRQLRCLFDLLPQVLYIKDSECRFKMANAAMAKLLELDSANDLIGKTDRDFYPDELSNLFLADERKLLREGHRIINQIEPGMDRRTRQKTWMMTTKIPVQNEQGKIVGLVGVGSDVTQFREQEDCIRLQAAALNAAANSVVITDRQGKIQWINEAFTRITGYPLSEVIGTTPQVLKSEQHPPEFFRKCGTP